MEYVGLNLLWKRSLKPIARVVLSNKDSFSTNKNDNLKESILRDSSKFQNLKKHSNYLIIEKYICRWRIKSFLREARF